MHWLTLYLSAKVALIVLQTYLYQKLVSHVISYGASALFYPVKYIYWPFQGGTSFVDHSCYFCRVFCYEFVRVCLLLPCGSLLGKGWPLGSRPGCQTVSFYFSICIPVKQARISPSQFFPWRKNRLAHSFPTQSVPPLIIFINHNGIIFSLQKFKKPLFN